MFKSLNMNFVKFLKIIKKVTVTIMLYMHNFVLYSSLFKAGIFLLIFVMYLWWRDVVREATLEEQHKFAVQRGLRLGMILFFRF